ncbi:MAG TPA: glycosyltransferase family 1 protein [Gammaproteobacteria bacterium]|nr:glycosyltransferase family 1 protein [Gammaproteobacteria bacterium]
MKILVLCTSPGLGGLELYAEREWQYLQQAGHECHFVIAGNGWLAQRNRHTSARIFHLPRNSKFFPLVNALNLARYIVRNHIDVVHMHWGKELNLAALAKRFSRKLFRHRVKLVYTRHMGITRSKKNFAHAFFYRQVDMMLTISKQVEKEARTWLPLAGDQIKLLYLGVADKTVDKPDCTGLPEKIRQSQFKVVLFGRIEHGKGQHLLVEAMAQLANRKLNISATFVGQVMNNDYFEKLKQSVKKYGLNERIAYLDFIDNPMAVMPCFDVVVLLTYCETFGLVLIEAMRAGVAVIGTNAGGVPEIIEHAKTGFLIEPGNSDALADALSRLYNDADLRQQLASSGKKRADIEFNSELHFNKLEHLLTAGEI